MSLWEGLMQSPPGSEVGNLAASLPSSLGSITWLVSVTIEDGSKLFFKT